MKNMQLIFRCGLVIKVLSIIAASLFLAQFNWYLAVAFAIGALLAAIFCGGVFRHMAIWGNSIFAIASCVKINVIGIIILCVFVLQVIYEFYASKNLNENDYWQ